MWAPLYALRAYRDSLYSLMIGMKTLSCVLCLVFEWFVCAFFVPSFICVLGFLKSQWHVGFTPSHLGYSSPTSGSIHQLWYFLLWVVFLVWVGLVLICSEQGICLKAIWPVHSREQESNRRSVCVSRSCAEYMLCIRYDHVETFVHESTEFSVSVSTTPFVQISAKKFFTALVFLCQRTWANVV